MASTTFYTLLSILPLFAFGRRDKPDINNNDSGNWDDSEAAANSSDDDNGGGIGTTAVIMIVAGSAIVVIIIVLIIVMLVVRSRRRSQGHQRMADPESQARNRPPSAADVSALPKKPGQPLVGPVKPPSYTGPSQGQANQAAEGDDHVYEDPDALRQGGPPPTYTFALRDGAQYPRIPSELGREIQGN